MLERGDDDETGADSSGEELVESLRQSEEEFRKVVEHVRDYAIFLLDPSGRVMSWNTGARELKGYTDEEIIGRHFSIFYGPEDVERGWPERELELAIEEGHFEDEGWRFRKDGSRFWASVVLTALHDDSGNVRGFMKITRDLTERRIAEQRLRLAHDDLEARVRERTLELEDANQRLRESERRLKLDDRRKDQFLAVLSHELRNPLAPVRTAIEILRRVPFEDPRLAKSVGILGRQVSHMTRLVDDLLDISRITSGKVHLQRKRIELSALCRAVVEDHRPATEASGASISVDLPPDPVWIDADAVRISQALGNIVANAIKFTGAGDQIRLVLRSEAGHAVVAISDTGMGIRADLLDRVFEPFTQDEQESVRHAGGLGIGLALVRGLVEMHGGTVRADSEGPNRGATFTIRIPLAPVEATETGGPKAPEAARVSRRVLLIEDNVDAAETMAMFLDALGHRVEVAYSGSAGLSLAQSFHPEVIVCDIGLADMSGLEVAPRLRKIVPDAYLIAATGYGQDEDRRRSREAGFDLHLTKPMDPHFLERVLEARGVPD